MTKAKKENAVILWNNFKKWILLTRKRLSVPDVQTLGHLGHTLNNPHYWDTRTKLTIEFFEKKSVKNRKKAIGTAKTASKVFAKKKYRNALGITLRAKKLYFTRVKNLLCTYLLSPCPSFALGRGDMFTFILRPKLSTTLMGAFWCVMFWIHRKPKGNAVLISANFVVVWYIGCPK